MTTEAILAPFRLHDYPLGQVIDPVISVGDDTVESAIDGFRVKLSFVSYLTVKQSFEMT